MLIENFLSKKYFDCLFSFNDIDFFSFNVDNVNNSDLEYFFICFVWCKYFFFFSFSLLMNKLNK